MKYIIFLYLFLQLFSLSLFSQNEVKHYQRKAVIDSIILPYQAYNSDPFDIKFDDTLYSKAKITIKKADLLGINRVSLIIIVEENMFTVNSMKVKGRRKFRALKNAIFSKLNISIDNFDPGEYCFDIDGKIIKLRYQDLGRSKVLSLIKSECEP